MLDHELSIVIPGRAAPKGSLKCVGGRGRHQLVEDNSNTKEWRQTVAGWVRRRWPADQRAIKGQPIGAEITFTLERPKSHYGTGRNARTVKPQYVHALPVSHATGDVDKLLRLVLDALQDAELLDDDCAVIEALTRKFYVDPDGASTHPFYVDRLGYPGVLIRLYPYAPEV